MTALELLAQGVTFVRERGRAKVLAPKGRPDLVAAIRNEVARRVPRLRGDWPERATAREACELCSDPLATGRGGMCALCALARERALIEIGRIPA